MKIFRKWWFWVGIVLIAVVAFLFFPRADKISYVSQTVKYADLVQTVDANGEVKSIDEVELSFGVSGTVSELLVSVGDMVGIGDLIAALDSSELVADVQSAYKSVGVVQGNLEKEIAGASEESIAVSQGALEVADRSLSSAKLDEINANEILGLTITRYAADDKKSNLAVESARDNVNQTITANAELISDSYDDLLGATWAGVIQMRSAIAKADEVLGMRNSTLNDDFEPFVSANNPNILSLARIAFEKSEISRDTAETAILSAKWSDSEQILVASSAVESSLDDATVLLLRVRQVVEGTPVGGTYSASDSTTLGASVDTARAALQADQAALQNAFQNVRDVLHTTSSNLEDAQNAFVEAQAGLDAVKALSDYQIASSNHSVLSARSIVFLKEAEVAKALASLKQTKASPRDVDLVSLEAEVARAQAAYQSALARLDRAEIRSPISGSVTLISVEQGEQVTGANAIVTVQTTQEQFQVVADVSESDISKVSLGDFVNMIFDAFGSDIELSGVIGKIDPAEKLIESVVYYEVTIYLDEAENIPTLRPGLSTDATITTDKRENILVVPGRAVNERDGVQYVRILDNGKTREKQVQTGLRGDMGMIEIISGLDEGEEVILREVHE